MNKTTYEQELAQKGFLLYTTVGRSMRPFLRSGQDLIRVEAKAEARLKAGDVALYRRKSGKYVLHRVICVRKNDYVFCGDNCWDLEPGIRDDQILGVLTAVIRDGKSRSVDSFGHRLLVNLWWMLYPLRAILLWTRYKLVKIWVRIKESA